jgi:hypothetical protein
LVWVAYNFVFSDKKLIKVPVFNNVFIVRNLEHDEAVFFNEYLLYMKKKGYQYSSDKRMGRIIWFEKDGKQYDFSYPIFRSY